MEKPPAQARGSNDCGAAVAYTMPLLGQSRPISYDPNLLPALRQWVQGVVMYGDINPDLVTSETRRVMIVSTKLNTTPGW